MSAGLWWDGERFVDTSYVGPWEPNSREANMLVMDGGPVHHHFYMFQPTFLPQMFYPTREADRYLLDTDTAVERTSLIDGKKSWFGVYRWVGSDESEVVGVDTQHAGDPPELQQ